MRDLRPGGGPGGKWSERGVAQNGRNHPDGEARARPLRGRDAPRTRARSAARRPVTNVVTQLRRDATVTSRVTQLSATRTAASTVTGHANVFEMKHSLCATSQSCSTRAASVPGATLMRGRKPDLADRAWAAAARASTLRRRRRTPTRRCARGPRPRGTTATGTTTPRARAAARDSGSRRHRGTQDRS